MALIEQVKNICTRLAPAGRHDLLLHHGIDILAPDLEGELRNIIHADRRSQGLKTSPWPEHAALNPANRHKACCITHSPTPTSPWMPSTTRSRLIPARQSWKPS